MHQWRSKRALHLQTTENSTARSYSCVLTFGRFGQVVETKKSIRLQDVSQEERGLLSSLLGFEPNSMLCVPVMGHASGQVVALACTFNKLGGQSFFLSNVAASQHLFHCVSQRFSLSLSADDVSVLLQEIIAEARNLSNAEIHLANEMMMYHMKVSEEEVTKLLCSGTEPVQNIHPSFDEFTYTPRSLQDDSTPTAVLSMFEDMGFINTYKIDMHTLARFCLMVKKGYRDPPYHNWMHAFSVSHFCYLLYKNLGLSNYLHSEGSVMERHHFAQAIAILNTHGCNIFEKFSRKDYQRMLDLMRDIILATDLAHHLRIFKDLQKIADAGYNPKSQTHRSLLLCLLMTSCDLSDQTKGWKTTRKIAELIYKEFFSQGDLEKAMGNRPSEMMDREKAYIPELQISFMEHIAMPIQVRQPHTRMLLQEIFPQSAELYERVAANREQWSKVSHKFTIRGLPSNNSLDFLDEEFELLQSQGAFGDDSHRMNGCLDDQ
ncbi:cGMP-dependent 3',5'-cyclic phosphodiesterase [Triplophysa tibetana]|uniref:cGMP-dependent 3',5'-cyclic phosphodiesterase n=1 Tax=Triplophysa tibetana TaxID=1572043 RepID=A0A5A9MXT4_9TELE|nr:cGMP-dependent 3',5'-cyclic phosphodiesterase [Triplophysa tibetana]